jgi:5'-nucleotidase
VGGAPLELGRSYRVVVNSFLAGGGDAFTALGEGTDRARAGNDLDALVAYLSAQLGPVEAPRGDRIRALP